MFVALLLVVSAGCTTQVEEVDPLSGFELSAELEDVTGGDASGLAQAKYEDDEYTMVARFRNLPEPEGSDFYEGWVVKPGSVISSGKAEKVDGEYENRFTSEEDLTGNTDYVLTIEPDDGNPKPAGHVLEGTLE